MPFQVSFSAKSTPKGLIQNFTAGVDQVVICDTTVFLEATVNGDLTGHLFLWEQIDGVAVTFNTPLNQFAINYTTANFQDKVFRFYIDKGTGIEQFDDVIMFSTPTFPYFGGVPDQNCLVNFGEGGLRCNQPSLVIGVELPPLFHAEILVDCDTIDNPELQWIAPCEGATLIQFVVQQRTVAGPWTDEAILSPTTLKHVPLVTGATYRVIAVILEDNSAISSASSNTVFHTGFFGNTPATNGSGLVLTQSMKISHHAAKDNTVLVPSYELFLKTLLICNPDDFEELPLPNNATQNHVRVPSYEVFLLTLLECPPDDFDDLGLPNNATANHVTIPSYVVLEFEGDGIGG